MRRVMRGDTLKKHLAAIAAALVLCGAMLAALALAGGVRHVPAKDLRSAYPSYEEVSSWDFMAGQYDALRDAGTSPQLVFGSSELKGAPAGPAHPSRLFADGRFGSTSVIAGRAGVNDLWQAIELGAFAPHMPQARRRAVIFVSMQWFMCYRDPASTFPAVFSQGAYDAFMANPQISKTTKERVAQRVRAYGVWCAGEGETSAEGLVRAVDRATSDFAADARLAHELRTRDAAAGGAAAGDAAAGDGVQVAQPGADGSSPDWPALIEDGRARASKASAGNEYGFYDSWYREKFSAWLEGAQRAWHVQDGVYFSQQEFEDLELMLDVCREAGIEPLIVIQPVKGRAYDQTIYTHEVREAYYTTVRAVCDRAGVEVADFSSYEYDPLFLRDYSHPSAYGSALYSQALYDFWTK